MFNYPTHLLNAFCFLIHVAAYTYQLTLSCTFLQSSLQVKWHFRVQHLHVIIIWFKYIVNGIHILYKHFTYKYSCVDTVYYYFRAFQQYWLCVSFVKTALLKLYVFTLNSFCKLSALIVISLGWPCVLIDRLIHILKLFILYLNAVYTKKNY